MDNTMQITNCDVLEKTKKILIADDNEDIRKTLSFIIKKKGFNILLATNGCEAIDQYKQNKPHLVFMDVRMPLLSGCNALKEIYDYDNNAKIVFLTGNSGDECVLELIKTKNIPIIEKPMQYEEIESILAPIQS